MNQSLDLRSEDSWKQTRVLLYLPYQKKQVLNLGWRPCKRQASCSPTSKMHSGSLGMVGRGVSV